MSVVYSLHAGVTGFGGFNNTSKKILNELEMVCLRLTKTELEGVAVIKFKLSNQGGDVSGHFDITGNGRIITEN